MNIYYNVTGSRRKELVQALSEITLWEAQYQGAPSFNFVVGNYTVTKDGTIMCPDGQPREIYEKLVDNLEKKGFTATRSDLNSVVIALPRKDYDDNALARLKNLIASKQTLLKAAIGTETLEVVEKDEKLHFPWFTNHGLDGEVEAYTRLIAPLAERPVNSIAFLRQKSRRIISNTPCVCSLSGSDSSEMNTNARGRFCFAIYPETVAGNPDMLPNVEMFCVQQK